MAEATERHTVVDDYGQLVIVNLVPRVPVDCFGFAIDMDNIYNESPVEGIVTEEVA